MLKNLMGIFNTKNLSLNADSTRNPSPYSAVIHLEDIGQKDKYYLSHAELQQVQEVVRENIRFMESSCRCYASSAKYYKIEGDKVLSEVCYKNVDRLKKRIKALSAVQAKLKHSLTTVG